jgi:hypothetical protein
MKVNHRDTENTEKGSREPSRTLSVLLGVLGVSVFESPFRIATL